MRKIVYINYQPLTEKYAEDFFLNAAREKDIVVEYWDITKLYFLGMNPLRDSKWDYVQIINTFSELNTLLKKNSGDQVFFITNITYEFKVWKLFYSLRRYNCMLGFFARGMYPIPESTTSNKIKSILLMFDIKRIKTALLNRLAILMKRLNFVKRIDLIFRSGSEGSKVLGFGYQYDLLTAKVIDINYFDYDKYFLYLNAEQQIPNKNYCVFLDEYLPYHPDVAMSGIKTVAPDSYYRGLNNFFDFIERKYGLDVVIAAHPKAQHYLKENPFNGRKLVFNQSCELTQHASFAITHHSTSISFPILFQKPILFISSDEQKKKMNDLYCFSIHLAKVLNTSLVHFDDFSEDSAFTLTVDAEKYNAYKYLYLTSQSSEGHKSADIFLNAVKAI